MVPVYKDQGNVYKDQGNYNFFPCKTLKKMLHLKLDSHLNPIQNGPHGWGCAKKAPAP